MRGAEAGCPTPETEASRGAGDRIKAGLRGGVQGLGSRLSGLGFRGLGCID